MNIWIERSAIRKTTLVTVQPSIDVASERAKSARMASLDGIRAISIALVIAWHLNGTRGVGELNFQIGNAGRLGVIIFFVISGFLITTLLLSEHAETGLVSLRRFYARRAIRILPASYTYLIVISVLSLFRVLHLQARDLWHAVTYTVNYMPGGNAWQIGHLWSLSVEEQFYLLWPFAFVALGPRLAVCTAAGVIAFGPFARAFSRMFMTGTPYEDLQMFPMVADSLATGCVLAWARGWLEQQGWYRQLFRPAYSLLLLALVLLINRYRYYSMVDALGTSLMNVSLAVLIHRSVFIHNDWVGMALNWRPVAFIGVLSYSLYVWQQLFLDKASGWWGSTFPQNFVLAITAAVLSYLLLEKPMLRLRQRLRT